nr:tRNA lysidine(34) synthetase TilS [Nonomuraea soli]
MADLGSGSLVLVACSGGADSLALAAALGFVAPRAGLRAGLLTVDHGLQEGSAAQARTVATLATAPAPRPARPAHIAAPFARDTARAASSAPGPHDLDPGAPDASGTGGNLAPGLGLDFAEVLTVTVGAGGGPEAAAREARYAALGEACERLGAAAVLLGHTRDDQAETVLLGLARGSGLRSLSGMSGTAGRYRRPLLDLPRRTTVAACQALGLRPWDDPHNRDLRYTRVRVRTAVLPLLERELGPGVAEALARTADLARADADALDGWASKAYADCALSDIPEAVTLAVPALEALPEAVRTRVLRRAALRAGSPSSALTAGHVRAVDRLITAWHGQKAVDLPGGLCALRRYGTLVFQS